MYLLDVVGLARVVMDYYATQAVLWMFALYIFVSAFCKVARTGYAGEIVKAERSTRQRLN